jgi:hypothetical protein
MDRFSSAIPWLFCLLAVFDFIAAAPSDLSNTTLSSGHVVPGSWPTPAPIPVNFGNQPSLRGAPREHLKETGTKTTAADYATNSNRITQSNNTADDNEYMGGENNADYDKEDMEDYLDPETLVNAAGTHDDDVDDMDMQDVPDDDEETEEVDILDFGQGMFDNENTDNTTKQHIKLGGNVSSFAVFGRNQHWSEWFGGDNGHHREDKVCSDNAYIVKFTVTGHYWYRGGVNKIGKVKCNDDKYLKCCDGYEGYSDDVDVFRQSKGFSTVYGRSDSRLRCLSFKSADDCDSQRGSPFKVQCREGYKIVGFTTRGHPSVKGIKFLCRQHGAGWPTFPEPPTFPSPPSFPGWTGWR